MPTTLRPPRIELVAVPAGEFIMGRTDRSYPDSGREDPAHSVTLDEYQIGRHPVTNEQYRAFVQDAGHPPPRTWPAGEYPEERAQHPVAGVTWADAWLFCAWLRHKTGLPYHLPTEAQWEKAATWDPVAHGKRPFPWGGQFDAALCNVSSSGRGDTTPVGAYSPGGDSAYGSADMLGNVDEWCNSVLWEYPYQADDGREELRAEGRRCTRGGGWYSALPISGIRRNVLGEGNAGSCGFRVALSQAVREAHQGFLRQVGESRADAAAQVNARAAQNGGDAAAYYEWAGFLLRMAQYGVDCSAEIEAALTETLASVESGKAKLRSPLAHVYYNRALARQQARDYEGAWADATRAVELDAADPDIFALRASIACDLHRWPEAQGDLEAGARLSADHPALRLARARLLKGQGELHSALGLLSDLIAAPVAGPLWYPELHLARAEIYERLGAPEQAASDYYHYRLWHLAP